MKADAIEKMLQDCLAECVRNGLLFTSMLQVDGVARKEITFEGDKAWRVGKRGKFDNGQPYLVACYGSNAILKEYRSWDFFNRRSPNAKELFRVKKDFRQMRKAVSEIIGFNPWEGVKA